MTQLDNSAASNITKSQIKQTVATNNPLKRNHVIHTLIKQVQWSI